MKKETYYITTPIYYVNALPHIGHAYTTIAVDTVARYQRDILKKDVFFLTGTDENSQKNVEAAEAVGENTQAYVDKMSARWDAIWKDLGITNDIFIRTTSDYHRKGVEKFFTTVLKNNPDDIYKGTYEGLYCIGCETFYSESDAVDGACPIHKRTLEMLKEENYFFKLTKYREKLLQYIKSHEHFITPETKRNEVVSYIENFMEDISISRSTMKWGIPVPNDTTQVLYVWFDALINYLSGVGYGSDEEKFKKYWPADVHVIGKDILKFHAALWPAMLMAADLPLPKRVVVQGYFTVDGEKMSKSLGNAINPVAAAERHGIEPLRYYLLSAFPYGNDGDVSMEKFEEMYNADLKNGIGNLLSRVLSMIEQYCEGRIPEQEKGRDIKTAVSFIGNSIENFEFHELLGNISASVYLVNQQINDTAPWKLAKEGNQKDVNNILGYCVEQIRSIAWALYPVMPETAKNIWTQLGLNPEDELSKDITNIGTSDLLPAGHEINKGDVLFT